MKIVKRALFTGRKITLNVQMYKGCKMMGGMIALIVLIVLLLIRPVVSIGQSATGLRPVTTSNVIKPALKARYELYAALEKENAGAQQPQTKASGVRIEAMERIHLVNIANTALTHIWVYLYPNSYSSDSTFLSEKLLQAGDLRLYFAKADQLGKLTDLDFAVLSESHGNANQHVVVTDPTGTAERLLLTLPEPLQPGDSLTLQTPFSLSLPEKLIDLGNQDKVSYLHNWFVQLDPSYQVDASAVHIMLTTSSEQQLYVDGQLQGPAAGQDPAGEATGINQVRYDLQVGLHTTIAIKAADNNTSIQQVASMSYFDPVSGRIIHRSNDFFQKLLPGPLAGKRPLRPDSVLIQMAAASVGESTQQPKTVRPAFLFNLKEADTKNYLSLSPAIGFNNYDRWMPGVLIHNYGLPVTPFKFILAPLYSTGDHTLSGLGHLSYTSRHTLSAWQISLDGSSYGYSAYNSWTDAADIVHEAGIMRLLRIVPAIRYKWSPNADHPEKQWRLEAKSFILKKDGWKPGEAKIIRPTTTIGETSVALKNSRVLYPYTLRLQLQGTDQFLRAGLTGDYFMNYDAMGKGLQLRGFAGKFFYLKEKDNLSSFNLGNYFFNLSGSNGTQDVTNSDYFVGRSEYEGWMSQQMTTTGGFFKVATPYLTEPIGQTDDWLAAINLTSDLPDGINPFAVLPFRLPVRVFLDVGTYSDLWSESPAAGRFLYDAGLQVSVLKQAVTIYFPLLYSKIYRDTYKSMSDLGTYSKRIRFSISLGKLLPKRLQKDMQW